MLTSRVGYAGYFYTLVGVKGGKLPTPEDYGLVLQENPDQATYYTSPYIATWMIPQQQLLLNQLTLNAPLAEYPPLNGLEPVFIDRHRSTYKCLNLPVDFTGGLLLGRGVIYRMVTYSNYANAPEHRTVLELCFQKGVLVGVRDHSAHFAKVRRQLILAGEFKHISYNASPEAFREWVIQRSLLDYEHYFVLEPEPPQWYEKLEHLVAEAQYHEAQADWKEASDTYRLAEKILSDMDTLLRENNGAEELWAELEAIRAAHVSVLLKKVQASLFAQIHTNTVLYDLHRAVSLDPTLHEVANAIASQAGLDLDAQPH